MCVTMPGEGGVSEGRDLIRCVRMGVCVWVQGVYLVKSSVGRRRWGFIKMNQPLPVSLSLSLSLSHSLNTKREWRPAAGSPKDSLINSHTRTSLHTLRRFPLQMWEKQASAFCCGSMKLCYADISANFP